MPFHTEVNLHEALLMVISDHFPNGSELWLRMRESCPGHMRAAASIILR